MRLWTLHPRYLDTLGLVAAWREALLAQCVLTGSTTGYKHHPQLIRFRSQPEPIAVIGAFLTGLTEEAGRRGYRFNTAKILKPGTVAQIEETEGQLLFEWSHLKEKLLKRVPALHHRYKSIMLPDAHPLFRIVPGTPQEWEKR